MNNGKLVLDAEPKRPRTNEELVLHLMNFSRCGGQQQIFVMTALEQYATAVVAAGAAACDSPMVNGAAWVACAQEIVDALKARAAAG